MNLVESLATLRSQLSRSAFGKHYSRLARIKKRYDPGNMFRFNRNIQPE